MTDDSRAVHPKVTRSCRDLGHGIAPLADMGYRVFPVLWAKTTTFGTWRSLSRILGRPLIAWGGRLGVLGIVMFLKKSNLTFLTEQAALHCTNITGTGLSTRVESTRHIRARDGSIGLFALDTASVCTQTPRNHAAPHFCRCDRCSPCEHCLRSQLYRRCLERRAGHS